MGAVHARQNERRRRRRKPRGRRTKISDAASFAGGEPQTLDLAAILVSRGNGWPLVQIVAYKHAGRAIGAAVAVPVVIVIVIVISPVRACRRTDLLASTPPCNARAVRVVHTAPPQRVRHDGKGDQQTHGKIGLGELILGRSLVLGRSTTA
jgi:hypothetical protein